MSITEPNDDRERSRQSALDRATVKVRLIENGVLVSGGEGWFTFATWAKASEHIGLRLERLAKERQEAPR